MVYYGVYSREGEGMVNGVVRSRYNNNDDNEMEGTEKVRRVLLVSETCDSQANTQCSKNIYILPQSRRKAYIRKNLLSTNLFDVVGDT